jgi:CubicO group peptidase (beta-lactamase class C family)
VEWPAGNGIGTVRSIAKAYAVFASGGRELALRPETLRALEEPTLRPSGGTRDMILKVETRFAMGFMKPFPSFRFGSNGRAYGTPGMGGSFGFADPDTGVGFACPESAWVPRVGRPAREAASRRGVLMPLRTPGDGICSPLMAPSLS